MNFSRAILNAVPAEIAVLDAKGVIIAINELWQQFSVENHCQTPVDIGVDYLEVCRAAASNGDATAAAALAGIMSLLESRESEFELEYPCDSPEEERWFLMKAKRLSAETGGVVIAHIDITAQKRTMVALNDARKQAESANEAKDRFLSALSHELRTPLTPVLAASQMLERLGDLPDKAREYLGLIKRNALVEARLIDDLLDITRALRGVLQIRKRPVDIAEILEAAIVDCRQDADAKSIPIVFTGSEQVAIVLGDPDRLKQVLKNVINNAVKFSSERGEILIQLTSSEAEIEINVVDQGFGLDAEFLDRVFNPFEKGAHDKERGLGLGLAICRSIMDLHSGTIEARSQGREMGTTIMVRIPRYKIPELLAERKILLVEDHPDTATLLKQALEMGGHAVQHADTVRGALELSRHAQFDLLLCDLGLPDGSGIDVLNQLGRDRPTRAAAISGYGQVEDIERCKAAGFDAHLTKPIDLDRLYQLVSRLLTEVPLSR